jgi:hypothetical protein
MRKAGLRPADHDLGGFDKGHGFVAGFKAEFPNRVGGDDRSDPLTTHSEHYLGQQPVDFDLDYGAEQLVAPADAGRSGMGGGLRWQKLIQCLGRHAMVAAGRLHGADASGQDPVLERWIAHADANGGLTRREQIG